MTRDEAMGRFLDMIGDAYASGAVDVHSAWVADLGQLEPDFGEATSDYRASVAEAAATVIQQAFAERDGEMREALALCAALPLITETLIATPPLKPLENVEYRIAEIARRRKAHDDAILAARQALAAKGDSRG